MTSPSGLPDVARQAGGPASDGVLIRHAELVMGTAVSFAVVSNGPDEVVAAAIRSACAVLHRADAVFSTWNPQSPVSRLRRGETQLREMPADVTEVLQQCAAARRATGGWFDPWSAPGGVDPTGLVKGWAVEQALGVLQDAGIGAAMVNGGGDIAVCGEPPDAAGPGWRIGVRHPWRPDGLAAIVTGVTAAIATSGRYERGQHLYSPLGKRMAAVASATVTGPSLAMADAIATALAAGGDDVLALVADLDGYEGYLIRDDGSEADTGGITFGQPGGLSGRGSLGELDERVQVASHLESRQAGNRD
jgi:FAD:protein FMN transferase